MFEKNLNLKTIYNTIIIQDRDVKAVYVHNIFKNEFKSVAYTFVKDDLRKLIELQLHCGQQ